MWTSQWVPLDRIYSFISQSGLSGFILEQHINIHRQTKCRLLQLLIKTGQMSSLECSYFLLIVWCVKCFSFLKFHLVQTDIFRCHILPESPKPRDAKFTVTKGRHNHQDLRWRVEEHALFSTKSGQKAVLLCGNGYPHYVKCITAADGLQWTKHAKLWRHRIRYKSKGFIYPREGKKRGKQTEVLYKNKQTTQLKHNQKNPEKTKTDQLN